MKLGDDSLYITRWGTEGATVVMIHGSAQGSPLSGADHFSAQERLARRGWRIVVPDRPGHGKSPAPGRPDDVDLDAEWVAELLGEGSHLVGHSLGGAIAYAAAARRPSAVRSLTLIEPGLFSLALDKPDVQAFVAKQIGLFSSGRPANEIAAEFSKMVGVPEEMRRDRDDRPSRVGVGASLLQIRFPAPHTLKEYGEAIARAHLPVLIVTGGWNPAFEATSDVVASLTSGRRCVVQSPHHFPNLVSDEFNDTLHDFMSEADRSR